MRATLDDAGVPIAAANYDAWGVPETPLIGSFGFTGELQQGSDVWLRARWYGAGRGSFGTRDPYVGDAETPYSMQYYQYAYSAPTVWVDPGGDTPCAPNPGIPVGNCGGGGGARGPGEPMGPTKPKPQPPGTVPYEPRIPRPEDGGGTGPGSLPPRNQPDVGGRGSSQDTTDVWNTSASATNGPYSPTRGAGHRHPQCERTCSRWGVPCALS